MQVKTEIIVLSALRYQEKSLVVKSFTKDFGLKTYFIRNAFGTKNKALNSAYFQPLNLLFVDATHKNKESLEYINELKLAYAYQTVATDFYKNCVAVFLAEVLANSLKDEQVNKSLFLYLKTALIWFDKHDFTPNFHLWFLWNLTKYLGFFPNKENIKGVYFNPVDGTFGSEFTPLCFNEDETSLFKKLFDVSLNDNRIITNNAERRGLLKLILRYYEIHIAQFKQIKSIEILPELFQ